MAGATGHQEVTFLALLTPVCTATSPSDLVCGPSIFSLRMIRGYIGNSYDSLVQSLILPHDKPEGLKSVARDWHQHLGHPLGSPAIYTIGGA